MLPEKLLLLKNIRQENYSGSLDEYIECAGFLAFKKAIKDYKPQEVIDAVKASGLRGRGGAGFPTGLKWSFMAKNSAKPNYLVCNADESEPGTFKDRELMLRDPLIVLEGLMLGCYAVNCNHGYIYVRGEFFPAIKKLQACIEDLYKKGYLGQNIFGSNFSLDITLHPGAGAYICGEETALLNSLEGKRGEPRVKPPFPAISGFDGAPTSVNNVETLANLPFILQAGPEAYKALGTAGNAGTRLICLSGHIQNPGVYEVEMGVNLKAIIEDLGGGMLNGNALKAVIPGGSSVPLFLPDEINIPYDFDSVAKAGSMMGSCGIVVLDEKVSIPEFLHRIIRFYTHESCGQCTPCREGMQWIRVMLRDLLRGQASLNTIDNIVRVANNIIGNTLCPLGDAGAMPTISYITKFRNEFNSLAKHA